MMQTTDSARRLVQVQQVLAHLHLPADHRLDLEAIAARLERKFTTIPAPRRAQGA